MLDPRIEGLSERIDELEKKLNKLINLLAGVKN